MDIKFMVDIGTMALLLDSKIWSKINEGVLSGLQLAHSPISILDEQRCFCLLRSEAWTYF